MSQKIPCPLCAKEFQSNTSVQKHLNQPNSRCRFLFENVVHFNNAGQGISMEALTPPTIDPMFSSLHSFEPLNYALPEGEPMALDIPTDTDLSSNERCYSDSLTQHSTSTPQSPFHKVEYPVHGTSDSFGTSKTFMDRFNDDVHAPKRQKNIFYPFASQGEWQLASYLLRSNLSMASIDEFLKLDLVSSHISSLYMKIQLLINVGPDLQYRAIVPYC